MANFPRIRPPGEWDELSTLTGEEMEQFDAQQFKAINGDEGSTHAPTSQIVIGGEGLDVTGPFHAADAAIGIPLGKVIAVLGQIQLGNGSLLRGFLGSEIRVDASASLNIDGTALVRAGGILRAESSGGAIFAASGGFITVNAGGFLDVFGTATIKSGANLTCQDGSSVALNGGVVIGATGSLIVHVSAEATVASASWTWTAASVQSVSGVVNLEPNSVLNLKAATTVGADATIAYTAGAAASGALTDATTTTRTGPTIYSGDNAIRSDRIASISIAGTSGVVDIDAWKHNIIVASGDPNGTRVWRLTAPPGNVLCSVWIRANIPADNGGDTLEVRDLGTDALLDTWVDSSGDSSGGSLFAFDGSAWFLVDGHSGTGT